LLESLKAKYGDQYLIEEIKEAEALNIEKLTEFWNKYAQKMDEQQKHSSANTFKLAKLKIEADNFFTVTVNAITQQKFIEQEKMLLADFIQQAFNNRSITFKVLVEQGEQEVLPANLTLNSRQRFEKLAEQYPLLKELKDKLRLELDY
jgi:DNA polymerase-3 subunit gamma/tau